MPALHRRQVVAGIASALTVGLAGCGGNSGNGTATDTGSGRDTDPTTETAVPAEEVTPARTETETETEARSDTARVRIAHMSPDAPDLVASVDGDVVASNLGVPFGRVGDYVDVPAGSRRLTLAELDGDDVLFDREVALRAADYTFLAAGEVVDDEPEFRVLPLVDDNSDPGADTARLRVLHVSPDAGPVDVTVDPGPVLFEGLEFTDGGYVSVEAGDYTVEVRSGTTSGDGEVIDDREVSLNGGATYTVFASGYRDVEFASETSFELTVVRDATS
jgi:hypothetical protein